MPRVKKGRVVRGARGKPAIASAALSAARGGGPLWKPEKPAEGNYGQLVSAAAKARNRTRKSTTGSAQPTPGGGGITSPGFNPRPVGGGSITGSTRRRESPTAGLMATAERLRSARPGGGSTPATPRPGKPASASIALSKMRSPSTPSLMPASMEKKVSAARKRSRY